MGTPLASPIFFIALRTSFQERRGFVSEEGSDTLLVLTRKDWESCRTVRDTSSETASPLSCRFVDAARRAVLYDAESCSDDRIKVRSCSSTLRLNLSRAVQEASADIVKSILIRTGSSRRCYGTHLFRGSPSAISEPCLQDSGYRFLHQHQRGLGGYLAGGRLTLCVLSILVKV